MKAETLRKLFEDMPPLDHFPKRGTGEPFRWQDSEVGDYILAHEKFMNRLLSQLRESGAIVFDEDSKTWRGCRVPKSTVKIPHSHHVAPPHFLAPTPPSPSKLQGVILNNPLYMNFDGRVNPNPLVPSEQPILTADILTAGNAKDLGAGTPAREKGDVRP